MSAFAGGTIGDEGHDIARRRDAIGRSAVTGRHREGHNKADRSRDAKKPQDKRTPDLHDGCPALQGQSPDRSSMIDMAIRTDIEHFSHACSRSKCL